MQKDRKNGNGRIKETEISTKSPQQKSDFLSLADLSRLTPKELRELFDRLSFSRRLGVILQLNGRQRQDLILLASHPEPLVHALPEEELLMTIKDIGDEDAVPIISLTSDSQLRYLMDVDLWAKDQLEPARALRWLTLILECGEDKVMQWFRSQDKEIVASIFYSFLHVAKPEEETAPPEHGLPSPYTLDNIYYLYFRRPGFIPAIGRFIDILRRRDENYYLWLMEELIWGLPAEREEMALRWRQARLDEKGFPSLDEALGLYQYLPDREMQRIIKSRALPGRAKPSESPLMPGWFLKSLREGDSLLSSALARIENSEQIDCLHREFIHLCNMCMVADGREPGDVAEIRKSTEKVLQFLNIGLEVIAEGNVQKAVDALMGLHLLFVFRAGYTQTLKLRLGAMTFLKSVGAQAIRAGTTILGDPLEGLLMGICRKQPLFYKGYGGKKGEAYREFNSLNDLFVAREALDTIRELDRMVREVLGWPGGAMSSPPPDVARLVRTQGITVQKVILTAMARLMLDGRFRFAPLSLKEATLFLSKIIVRSNEIEKPWSLAENIATSFAAWLRENWKGATDQTLCIIERFVERSLLTLLKETAFLSLAEPLDSKSIESLVIEES
jgi:hypothetical protein